MFEFCKFFLYTPFVCSFLSELFWLLALTRLMSLQGFYTGDSWERGKNVLGSAARCSSVVSSVSRFNNVHGFTIWTDVRQDTIQRFHRRSRTRTLTIEPVIASFRPEQQGDEHLDLHNTRTPDHSLCFSEFERNRCLKKCETWNRILDPQANSLLEAKIDQPKACVLLSSPKSNKSRWCPLFCCLQTHPAKNTKCWSVDQQIINMIKRGWRIRVWNMSSSVLQYNYNVVRKQRMSQCIWLPRSEDDYSIQYPKFSMLISSAGLLPSNPELLG